MRMPTTYRQYIPYVVGGVVLTLSLALFLVFGQPDIFNLVAAPNKDAASEYFEAPHTSFLDKEEAVVITTEPGKEVTLPITKLLYEYVEVTNGCGPHFEGECLNVRSGPGLEFPVVAQLRNNVVLKVDGKVKRDGSAWIKLTFDEWLRYPERVTNDWYVAAEYVDVVLDEGDQTLKEHGKGLGNKEIVVDREEQKLYAYEDGTLFMEVSISTGLELTPTPRGTFTVFKKTPSRYMQGPIPSVSDQYYDLPGVPWNLYFTHDGAVIHGAYWHTSFGSPYSHGCVNLPPDEAHKLYTWAGIGTKVIVRN